MGRYTTSVVVPFKAEGVAAADNHQQPSVAWQKALCDDHRHGLPTVPNTLGPNGTHDPNYIDGIDFGKGWVYYSGCCREYTHHNNMIVCDELLNEAKDLEVLAVNEAYYDGVWYISLFADTEDALKEFLNDMGHQAAILATAAVQQTG